MLNVVIPMAGNGSRFKTAGYANPKPFIDVNGVPMIEAVMKNLGVKANYYLIAKPEDLQNHAQTVERIKAEYNAEFIPLESNFTTEGAACTILHARKYINNSTPLLFANSDQIVDCNIQDFINDMMAKELDASILTFHDHENNPKWSFAESGEDGLVKRVAEKVVISNKATVGIYLFKQGSIFCDGAVDMIVRNDRFNNEFYVCPVYNYIIKNGYKVGTFEIPAIAMHGIGTPEDLKSFLALR